MDWLERFEGYLWELDEKMLEYAYINYEEIDEEIDLEENEVLYQDKREPDNFVSIKYNIDQSDENYIIVKKISYL